jgi:hypothetical protein
MNILDVPVLLVDLEGQTAPNFLSTPKAQATCIYARSWGFQYAKISLFLL